MPDSPHNGHTAHDSTKPLAGLGPPEWIGVLGIGTGICRMLDARSYEPGLFRDKRRLGAGDPIKTITPDAVFAPADSLL